LEIREAVESEAGILSALAFDAKAQWGYSRETMESWKGQLAFSVSNVASRPTYVAAISGEIVGFYSLAPSQRTWELDNLWVAPHFMRRGVGRALLTHALAVAFRGGATSVTVDSEPNAEAFYLSLGAMRCGEIAAPIPGQPNRLRPQLMFNELVRLHAVVIGHERKT
jgi:GNAT superfamily N-acetyltransferase